MTKNKRQNKRTKKDWKHNSVFQHQLSDASKRLGVSKNLINIYRQKVAKMDGVTPKEHNQLVEFILACVESGMTSQQIVGMLEPSKGTAVLPVVPRHPSADPLEFQKVCAIPILRAIELNLPLIQEVVTFNGLSYSKLILAYYVNLLDTYRHMKGEIPIVTSDNKTIMDLKAALEPKEVTDDGFPVMFTWDNVGQNLLDFLGLSAYPEDIPIGTAGFLSVPNLTEYPEINLQTTNLITDEVVSTEFLQYYIELSEQISVSERDFCRCAEYESVYSKTPALWAYNITTSFDTSSAMNKYADVRLDKKIDPHAHWLALLPMAQSPTVIDNTLRVQFTGYSGVVHYHLRLQKGWWGSKIRPIVQPAFINAQQILEKYTASVVAADLDLAEIKPSAAGPTAMPADGVITNTSQSQHLNYVVNWLNSIYHSSASSMSQSMPAGFKTFSGMEYVPNPNFKGAIMFQEINEQLEVLGEVRIANAGIKLGHRHPGVIKVPVPYFSRLLIGEFDDTSISKYSSIGSEWQLTGNFLPSAGFPPQIPQTGAEYCYTKGTVVQRLWNQFANTLAPLGNVHPLGSFEGFSKYNDYDKLTIVFNQGNVDLNDAENANRHFLCYERQVSEAEKTILRFNVGQVMFLGSESLSASQKLERVRTCQTFFDFAETEFVDTTFDASFEEPNNLVNINNEAISFFRRYRYQEYTSSQMVEGYWVMMKGEGANWGAVLRRVTGGILKHGATIFGKIAEKFLPGTGDDITKLSKNISRMLLEHKAEKGVSTREPTIKTSTKSYVTRKEPWHTRKLQSSRKETVVSKQPVLLLNDK